MPEQPWLELRFTLGSLGIPLAYALFVVLAAGVKPGWSLRVDTQAHLTSFEIALSRVEKRGVDWIHQSLANLGGWVQQRRGRLSR